MITVNRRKKNFLTLETAYYPEDYTKYSSDADIVLFYFSSRPVSGAREFNTLQIDLTKSEDQLMNELHKSTRHDIVKIQKEGRVTIRLNESPTETDLAEYCRNYDIFAEMKSIKGSDLSLLKQFAEQKALELKTAYDADGNILSSLCNLHTGHTVLGFYAYSNFRLYEDKDMRRFTANANKYLYWQDILTAKAQGYKILDMGGLGLGREGAGMDHVDEFKQGFGGSIVTLYQFYHPLTYRGKIAVNLLKLNRRIEF